MGDIRVTLKMVDSRCGYIGSIMILDILYHDAHQIYRKYDINLEI